MRFRPLLLAMLGVLVLALPTSAYVAPSASNGDATPVPRRLSFDPVDGHVVGASASPSKSTAKSDQTHSAAIAAESLTIHPLARYLPRDTSLGGRGGTSGALYTLETADGATRRYQWATLDGQVTDLGLAPEANSYNTVAGEDVLAIPGGTNGYPFEWVDLKDLVTQAVQRIPLGGLYHVKTIGRTVIAATTADITVTNPPAVVHLMRIVDGAVHDQVLPPMPCTLNGLGDGDGGSVIAFCDNKTVGLIDLSTGVFTPVSQKLGWGQAPVSRLTPTHVIWKEFGESITAAPRPGGPASTVSIPMFNTQYPLLGMSGQWFVGGNGYKLIPLEPNGDLSAVPPGGGQAVKLIDWPYWLAQLNDGTLLTVAGLPGAQGLYRIAPGSGGRPTVTLIRAIAPADAPTVGIALAGRRLATADGTTDQYWVGDRSLGVSGPFTAGSRRTLGTHPYLEFCNGPCVPLKVTGGTTVYKEDSALVVVDARGRARHIPVSRDSSNTIQLSDSYIGWYPYDSPQYSRLIDLRDGHDLTPPTTSWTLWGNDLWAARADYATSGVVTRTDLRTGATTSVTTPGRCHPNVARLQVVGRWLMWMCGYPLGGSPQGVVDLITGRVISLPYTDGVLGDGYFVYREFNGGVWRVNLVTGVPDAAPIAQIDRPLLQPWLGVQWTVDSYGGQCLAWSDAALRVHVQPIDTPAATPLTLLTADVPSRFTEVWQPTWTLSKPVTWRLVIRSGRTTVATLTGSSYGTAVTPEWASPAHQSPATGAVRLPAFEWELTLSPADGIGPQVALSGGVVNGTAPAPPAFDGSGVARRPAVW